MKAEFEDKEPLELFVSIVHERLFAHYLAETAKTKDNDQFLLPDIFEIVVFLIECEDVGLLHKISQVLLQLLQRALAAGLCQQLVLTSHSHVNIPNEVSFHEIY